MFYCVYVDNVEEESDLDLDEALELVGDILEECPDKLIRIEPMADEDEEDGEESE